MQSTAPLFNPAAKCIVKNYFPGILTNNKAAGLTEKLKSGGWAVLCGKAWVRLNFANFLFISNQPGHNFIISFNAFRLFVGFKVFTIK